MDEELKSKLLEILNALKNKDTSTLSCEDKAKHDTLVAALEDSTKIKRLSIVNDFITEFSKYPMDKAVIFSKGDSALYTLTSDNIKIEDDKLIITI